MNSVKLVQLGLTFVFGCVTGALITLAAARELEAGSALASGITKEGILQIRPGMKEADVLLGLGRPLFEDRFVAVVQGPDNRPLPGSVTWVYAKHGFLETGWDISVAFVDGMVISVWAEDRESLVYRCNEQKCPDVVRPRQVDRLPSKTMLKVDRQRE